MTEVAGRPKLGMSRGIPPVSFRVTAADRAALESLAAEAGLTVNELARARAVAGLRRATDCVTPAPARDLTVEYDEVPR